MVDSAYVDRWTYPTPQAFLFSGQQVARWDVQKKHFEGAQLISAAYPGLPFTQVDATYVDTFTSATPRLMVFNGAQVAHWNLEAKTNERTVPIAAAYPGLPFFTKIDAAYVDTWALPTPQLFVIAGQLVAQWDLSRKVHVGTYPLAAAYPGLPLTQIDAAYVDLGSFPTPQICFFSGPLSARWDARQRVYEEMQPIAAAYPGLAWDAFGPEDPNHVWTNWDSRQKAIVARRFRPTKLEHLVAIVKSAAGSVPNIPVRAVGSSWSFSDVAVPGFSTPGGYLVETSGLNATLPVPLNPSGEFLFHVEAGIRLLDLNMRLDREKGWALDTMGGSAGQTLAGAISTGTHGGAHHLAPIADLVRAIQLVGPDGNVYWIERSPGQGAFTSDANLRAQFPYLNPANIKRDDDWFRSVLVSMGSMGIIYSMILAVRPAFLLEQRVTPSKWSQVRGFLADGSLLQGTRNRFLEVILTPNFAETDKPHVFGLGEKGDRTCQVIEQIATAGPFPDRDDNGDGGCNWAEWLKTHPAGVINALATIVTSFPNTPATPGLTQILSGELTLLSAKNPDMMGALFGVVDIARRYQCFWMLPELEKLLLPLGPRKSGVGRSFEIMTDKSVNLIKTYVNPPLEPTPQVDSIEIFLDATTNAYLDAIDGILDVVQANGVFGGYVAVRFTKKTIAYLGMQQAPGLNCSVEVTLFSGLAHNDDLIRALQAFAIQYGLRLHWGQRNELLNNPETIARLYSDLPIWRSVRSKLTQHGALKTFDNAFTTRLGLSSPFHSDVEIIGPDAITLPRYNVRATTLTGEYTVSTKDMVPPLTVTWTTPTGPMTGPKITARFAAVDPANPVPQSISVSVTDRLNNPATKSKSVSFVMGDGLDPRFSRFRFGVE